MLLVNDAYRAYLQPNHKRYVRLLFTFSHHCNAEFATEKGNKTDVTIRQPETKRHSTDAFAKCIPVKSCKLQQPHPVDIRYYGYKSDVYVADIVSAIGSRA